MNSYLLQKGDEIRVIAPSLFADISAEKTQRAKQRLEKAGYRVSFSKGLNEGKKNELTKSLPLQDRINDLHTAYSDPNVKCIIPIVGGYNANQLLALIDFDLIKNNPKFFCGYSDITVLNNAIHARTGQVTFSGPNFNNFGVYEESIFNYTFDSFLSVLNNQMSEMPSAEQWVDNWVDDENNIYQPCKSFNYSNGSQVINEGNCKGKLIGGNLCSFNLLQGTPYMPDLTNSILFIEDDQIFSDTETFLLEFQRNLVSLLQQPNFDKVKAILIGRFEQKSGITLEMLREILLDLVPIKSIPIITNLDFGHTSPMLTLPVGGLVSLISTKEKCQLTLRDA